LTITRCRPVSCAFWACAAISHLRALCRHFLGDQRACLSSRSSLSRWTSAPGADTWGQSVFAPAAALAVYCNKALDFSSRLTNTHHRAVYPSGLKERKGTGGAHELDT